MSYRFSRPRECVSFAFAGTESSDLGRLSINIGTTHRPCSEASEVSLIPVGDSQSRDKSLGRPCFSVPLPRVPCNSFTDLGEIMGITPGALKTEYGSSRSSRGVRPISVFTSMAVKTMRSPDRCRLGIGTI